MRNQKGEVVTGVMVVVMVVMMFFMMPLMHGGHKDHGDHKDPVKDEKKHERAGTEPMHMHNGHGDPLNSTRSAATGTK